MTFSTDTLVRLAALVGDARRAATDVPLPPLTFAPDLDCSTSGGFDSLVTRLYRWTKEECRQDFDFLVGNVAHPDAALLRTFRRDLNALRQQSQHSGPDRRAQAVGWFRRVVEVDVPTQSDQWSACAVALHTQAENAFRVLIAMARHTQSDPLMSAQWRRIVESMQLDIQAAVAGALQLLGRRPPLGTVGFLERQVDNEWSFRSRNLSPTDDRDGALRAIAAKVVVGWATEPLPMSPYQLLSALGLSPGDVLPALLIAHAVAEVADDDEELMPKVESTFEHVRARQSQTP